MEKVVIEIESGTEISYQEFHRKIVAAMITMALRAGYEMGRENLPINTHGVVIVKSPLKIEFNVLPPEPDPK